MSLTLEEIVSKIASQGKNPDISFLKDNPEAQVMLLSAILSHTQNKNITPERSMSASIKSESEVPAPRKPGRKPVSDEDDKEDNPKTKRKAQNRAAQRAFRERKENQVRILQDKVKELESLHLEKKEALLLENQQLKDLIKKYQDENSILLGSAVSFDFPLSSTGQDERPQKLKKQNYELASPISLNFDMSSTTSGSSYSSKSRSNTPEEVLQQQQQQQQQQQPFSQQPLSQQPQILSQEPQLFHSLDNSQLIQPLDSSQLGQQATETELSQLLQQNQSLTVDDILNNATSLPSDALIDHSELLGLNNTKIDFSTSQLDDILHNFNFETNPSQFDFFPELIESNPPTNQFTLTEETEEVHDMTKVWDKLSEHPRFDEFNIDILCDEMKKKATCKDYDHDKCLEKLVNEKYPIKN